MAQPRLRIYYGPDETAEPPFGDTDTTCHSATIPLGEVVGWLVEAAQSGKTWLRDFEDDEVTISNDLYEVILAYQHYRRPSA